MNQYRVEITFVNGSSMKGPHEFVCFGDALDWARDHVTKDERVVHLIEAVNKQDGWRSKIWQSDWDAHSKALAFKY